MLVGYYENAVICLLLINKMYSMLMPKTTNIFLQFSGMEQQFDILSRLDNYEAVHN